MSFVASGPKFVPLNPRLPTCSAPTWRRLPSSASQLAKDSTAAASFSVVGSTGAAGSFRTNASAAGEATNCASVAVGSAPDPSSPDALVSAADVSCASSSPLLRVAIAAEAPRDTTATTAAALVSHFIRRTDRRAAWISTTSATVASAFGLAVPAAAQMAAPSSAVAGWRSRCPASANIRSIDPPSNSSG